MGLKKPLHVAVGVIKDRQGNILISLRHEASHQGGLWEFPGGKVEDGEAIKLALKRELNEELGISVKALHPLIKVSHQYDGLDVLLDVWKVTVFSGEPYGREGQAIKWVSPEQLANHSFPEANYPIINAAKLPSEYAILNGTDLEALVRDLQTILDDGIRLIQARIKSLSSEEVECFFARAIPLCSQKGAWLLVNSAVKNADKVNADGLHLTSQDLLGLKQKPGGHTWVSASCHNQLELKRAEQLGIDFVVLAPVLTTNSHPGAKHLGWDSFKVLTSSVNLPVFALGGMQKADKLTAQKAGAQGIAGITTFLSK